MKDYHAGILFFAGEKGLISFLNEKFTENEIRKAFAGIPKSRLERIIESLKDKNDESSKG